MAFDVTVKGARLDKDIRALIFDLDGTIVTTEDAWEKAALSWLSGFGITQDAYKEHESYLGEELLGVTPKAWFSALRDTFNLPLSDTEVFDQVRKLLFEKHGKDILFIHGFETFYDQMVAKHVPRAIATNSDDESLHSIDALMNLKRFFGTHIYNISMVPRGKPHPDLYLHAARALNVDPAHCLVLEDSAVGISAAKAAGMTCVGITSAGKPDLLREADLLIDSYDEILI